MNDGIDWAELDRRWLQGDAGVEYLVVETIKAGQVAAKAIAHCLDRYYRADTITARQYDAGNRLYQDYLIATHNPSQSSYDGTPAPEQYGPRSISDAQLDASRRYHEALREVGKRASFVLTSMVLAEYTAEDLGRHLGQTRQQVVGSLKLALDMLADHYRIR